MCGLYLENVHNHVFLHHDHPRTVARQYVVQACFHRRVALLCKVSAHRSLNHIHFELPTNFLVGKNILVHSYHYIPNQINLQHHHISQMDTEFFSQTNSNDQVDKLFVPTGKRIPRRYVTEISRMVSRWSLQDVSMWPCRQRSAYRRGSRPSGTVARLR